MSDNKIPTAEEFLNDLEVSFQKTGKPFFYKDALKVFAKLHVEAALKNCLDKYHHSIKENYDFGSSEIMNSYSLTNIK